jgi:hypothetical protein
VSQLLFQYYEWEMGVNGYEVKTSKMRSTINSVVKAMLCASKSDHDTLTKGLRHTHMLTPDDQDAARTQFRTCCQSVETSLMNQMIKIETCYPHFAKPLPSKVETAGISNVQSL